MVSLYYEDIGRFLTKRRVAVCISFFLLLAVLSPFLKFFPFSRGYVNYDSPMLWPMGVLLVVLFDRHLKFCGSISRICRFCAPSMFGVYLLHTVSLGNEYIARLQGKLSMSFTPNMHPASIVVISAVIIFAGCLFVDITRRVIVVGIKVVYKRIEGMTWKAKCH